MFEDIWGKGIFSKNSHAAGGKRVQYKNSFGHELAYRSKPPLRLDIIYIIRNQQVGL